MTRVLLYWNHICVLHKGEKKYLDQLAQTLAAEEIELQVRYFGLGYPEHMSEYLARPDAELPDIIVSADLEVFEDPRIYSKFKDTLYPAANWIPLQKGHSLDAVWREERLLPFLSIPLVYYTKTPEICAHNALLDWEGLAFGGINNSAAKTVVKTIWSHCGKKAAAELLAKSVITDMPIGAFQLVRTGRSHTALVPSIYALRADEAQTFLRMPKEGPILIPSYVCARASLPEAVARRMVEAIISPALCRFYAQQGDLILYPQCAAAQGKQTGDRYFTPKEEWFRTVTVEEFYDLYCEYIPSAVQLDVS